MLELTRQIGEVFCIYPNDLLPEMTKIELFAGDHVERF